MTHPSRSSAGRLLVAEPWLSDPNFARTVVFMIEHHREGAVGVVLNRPTEVAIAEVLADWQQLVNAPPVLHIGGPVEQGSVLGLGWSERDAPVVGWSEIIDRVGTLDLHVEPAMLVGELAAVRLFAGYSGWGPGQLDGELDEGAWFVVDALPPDVFDPDPETLWRRVLRRQPDELALLADMPLDVSVN
jgi:putative transcriptional regulator